MGLRKKSIESTIPNDLIPAIGALEKSLDDAHWKCGRITEIFCYALLHPGEKDAEAKEHALALTQLKAIVGSVATQSFNSYLDIQTLPAFFHALFDLYMAGVTTQAIKVFRDLVEIGRTHEERLGKPHIQWAQELSIQLIESFAHRPKMWVRGVCDPQDGDFDFHSDDPDALIIGRTWCAPLLVVMKPSRSMPYDRERVWNRTDRETSRRWLHAFAEEFLLHLEVKIKQLAGEEAVKLAKQPKPIPEPAKQPADARQEPILQIPKPRAPIKRAYNKLKNAERDRKIRAEFKKLKQRRPGMSLVWYSQQLEKSTAMVGELSAETIRKIIRN